MEENIFRATDPLMMIELVSRDYEFNMPIKHFHDEYEIYYLLSGERYYFIDHQTYHVKKGSIVLLDTNQIHKTGMANSAVHKRLLIHLNKDMFEKYSHIFSGLDIPGFFKMNFGVFDLSFEEQKYLEGIIFFIMEEIKYKKSNYEKLILAKIVEFFIFIFRKKEQITDQDYPISVQTAKHKKVHEVANYLSRYYYSSESLDELAKRFFVSKYYLCRIFKEVTGLTVNEYITINRIKQAKILLERSDLSITEIADQIGYNNISHFEKVFKKHLEMTPLKYRKSFK